VTPKQFVKLQRQVARQIEQLETKVEDAREQVVMPDRDKLRPMTPDDVLVGNVAFANDLSYWLIIEEVRHPTDPFKGWVSDGCRFGYEGKLVYK
jgi:hypothetical protein